MYSTVFEEFVAPISFSTKITPKAKNSNHFSSLFMYTIQVQFSWTHLSYVRIFLSCACILLFHNYTHLFSSHVHILLFHSHFSCVYRAATPCIPSTTVPVGANGGMEGSNPPHSLLASISPPPPWCSEETRRPSWTTITPLFFSPSCSAL